MPNVQTPSNVLNLDQAFLEMRARCLSLAADIDRLDRLVGPSARSDPRMAKLLQAVNVLTDSRPDRAARVQMIFTGITPPPPYGKTHKQ